jgi:hypothetical protein
MRSRAPSKTEVFNYLLYKYKRTNTDADGALTGALDKGGTQFTCFTSTKVRMLTQKAVLRRRRLERRDRQEARKGERVSSGDDVC